MFLILGASSYIGRKLFHALGSSQAIGTHCSNPAPGTVFFDATSGNIENILSEGSGISHAFIVFAEGGMEACRADINRSRMLNVLSAKSVIDQLLEKGIKPIFMSSVYVFDGEQGYYSEDDPAITSTVYGAQKLETEQYLAQSGGDYAVLRLGHVYDTDPEDRRILSEWLRQINHGEVIRCARDQVFSPVHVEDVVAASIAAARLDLSGLYHIAGPERISRLQMLRLFLGHLDADARVEECSINDFDFLEHRPLDLSMNPQKILNATRLSFRTIDSCCREFAQRSQQPAYCQENVHG